MTHKNDWTPGELLGLSGSYWQACTLHTAVKLEVFTLIGEKKVGAEDVAGLLKADKRAVSMLLNALAAMGLLIKTGDRYGNTDASRSFLVKASPQYLGYMIMHQHHLVVPWANLDTAVLTGQPTRRQGPMNDEERESFLMGMFNMAMGIAPGLVKEVDLGGKEHLLDLGGGPGTYAIHFCLENAGLKATVFDLPETRPFAEKTIEKFGLSERIAFQDGDYLADEIKGSYDVAWLSHILHGEGVEGCEKILRSAASALRLGAMILVHDFILDNSQDGPLWPAIFSLNMLVNTEKGSAYSENQIKEMMTRSGFRNIKRISFTGPNDSGVMCGQVAS